MEAQHKPICALVVDDEALARRRLTDRLAKDSDIGQILEAANGAEAIALIQQAKPDIIFLDVLMPGMDGIQILEVLSRRNAKCRIVLMSGADSGLAEAEAMAKERGLRLIGVLYKIVPKIGPLRPLAFKVPNEQAERLFLDSLARTRARRSSSPITRSHPLGADRRRHASAGRPPDRRRAAGRGRVPHGSRSWRRRDRSKRGPVQHRGAADRGTRHADMVRLVARKHEHAVSIRPAGRAHGPDRTKAQTEMGVRLP